jgi:hypothetical protein
MIASRICITGSSVKTYTDEISLPPAAEERCRLTMGRGLMKRILFAFLLVMTVGLQVDEAQAASDLTGIWKCNDGGKYFLRQVGVDLWWLGESQDKGGIWTNVYQGKIQGTQIRGRWADVPQGQTMNSGEMILQINNANQLTAVSKTGGFGGSLWTREGAVPPPLPPAGIR